MRKRESREEKADLDPDLRNRAEDELARTPGAPLPLKVESPEKIIQELRVHQIEIEMQNEELRRTQLSLEESRSRYRDLYDFAPVGYFTITDKGLITEVNLTGAGLLGVVRQKLLNDRFRRFVAQEDQGLWDRHLLGVLKGEVKQTCDLLLRRADGSTFPVYVESVRLRAGDGASLARTVVSDITSRRQLEGRERLVQKLLQMLNSEELTMDRLGGILKLVQKNLGFEAVGIRLKEGEDFPYYETAGFSDDFVQAEKYLCRRDALGKILCNGEGKPILECMCGNVICKRSDPAQPFFTEGGTFWTNSTTDLLASTSLAERQGFTRNRCNRAGYESMALIPLRSGDGILGLLQLNDRQRDLFTEPMISFLERLGDIIGIALSRLKAEEALRKSEHSFRSLFEHMMEGDAYCRILRDETGLPVDFVYLEVNSAFERLTGLKNVVGKKATEVIPGIRTVHPDLIETYGRVASTGQSEKFELYFIPLAAWLSVSVYSPQHEYFVMVFENITERKTIEKALQEKTNDLEESNRGLESFSYTISHDLRAPLRAIDGYSRMLQKELSDRAAEDEVMRKITVIRDSARRMEGLISDVLALSRLGSQALAKEILDMTGLVREVWQEAMEANQGRVVRFDAGTLPPVLGDRILLKQVLANLLGNALKYTGLKERADIRVDSYNDGNVQIFFVQDNGAGFDMRYSDKLFGLFSRLHADSEFEGHGAGLAIVQQIIKRHGGRVWADGKVGEGATFYFSLPMLSQG